MAVDLIVFNRQVSTLTTQLIRQNLDVFNQASGGALTLSAGASLGDFVEQSLFAALDSLVNRRDPYADGDVTAQELAQILDRAVKIHGRVGPLKVTPARMELIGKTVQDAATVFSAQVTKGILQDYVNTAAGVAGALIGAQSELVTDLRDATTPTTANLVGLQKGVRPFGDAFSSIQCWIMDGLTYNDLLTEDILKNGAKLFEIGNVNIFQDGLGRRFIVADIPTLQGKSGSGATLKNWSNVLGLTTGAVQVQAEGLKMYDSGWVTGHENVYTNLQGEYEFLLGVKNFAWKSADANTVSTPRAKAADSDDSVTRAPNTASIMKPANWNKLYKDRKDAPGVLVQFGGKA